MDYRKAIRLDLFPKARAPWSREVFWSNRGTTKLLDLCLRVNVSRSSSPQEWIQKKNN